MTLPDTIFWPPKSFTPSRWPALSRPLREEPPAFLCAMGVLLLLAARDRRDLDLGERLAMAALAMRVLAALLLEGDDFLALAMLEDLGRDRGAGNERRAMLRLVAAQHQHVGELELVAHVAGDLLDDENVVLRHFILLPAGADNREHGPKSLKTFGSARADARRKPRNILTSAPESRQAARR